MVRIGACIEIAVRLERAQTLVGHVIATETDSPRIVHGSKDYRAYVGQQVETLERQFSMKLPRGKTQSWLENAGGPHEMMQQ
jgi:hypothetical protein